MDPLRLALTFRRTLSFLEKAVRAGASLTIVLPPIQRRWAPRLRRLGLRPLLSPVPAGFFTNCRSFSTPLPSLLLLLDPSGSPFLGGEAALLRIPVLAPMPVALIPTTLLYPLPVEVLSLPLLLRFLLRRGSLSLFPPSTSRRWAKPSPPAPPFRPLIPSSWR